jgi:hypothetical protein
MTGGSGSVSGAEKTTALILDKRNRDNDNEINMMNVRCQLMHCFGTGRKDDFIAITPSYLWKLKIFRVTTSGYNG